jgi:uncharacterized protein YndB with AHSA1/START domain
MKQEPVPGRSSNSSVIHAAADVIYRALTDPEALPKWLVPGGMTAKVHRFDLRVGGGYEMSLFYPADDAGTSGKTSENEDRYAARFLELAPNRKIVLAIVFDSDDPGLKGEMIETITLAPVAEGTRITFDFTNIPPAIRPEDNEAGTKSSLEKLAHYVETQIP